MRRLQPWSIQVQRRLGRILLPSLATQEKRRMEVRRGALPTTVCTLSQAGRRLHVCVLLATAWRWRVPHLGPKHPHANSGRNRQPARSRCPRRRCRSLNPQLRLMLLPQVAEPPGLCHHPPAKLLSSWTEVALSQVALCGRSYPRTASHAAARGSVTTTVDAPAACNARTAPGYVASGIERACGTRSIESEAFYAK